MSIGLVESYYRAFNARDYNGMLVLLADDVAHDVNQGQREVGKDRFGAFLKRMHESYREELRDLVILGEPTSRRFAAEMVVEGEYLKADAGFPPAFGQKYRLPVGAFFEVSHKKIARVTTYYNLEDWLQQISVGSLRP